MVELIVAEIVRRREPVFFCEVTGWIRCGLIQGCISRGSDESMFYGHFYHVAQDKILPRSFITVPKAEQTYKRVVTDYFESLGYHVTYEREVQ